MGRYFLGPIAGILMGLSLPLGASEKSHIQKDPFRLPASTTESHEPTIYEKCKSVIKEVLKCQKIRRDERQLALKKNKKPPQYDEDCWAQKKPECHKLAH